MLQLLKPLLFPLLSTLLGAVLTTGCQTPEEAAPRSADLAASPGLRVTISAAGDLAPATVQAIVAHLEGNPEHGAALVRVEKVDDADPVIAIELWGSATPAPDQVAGQLKAAFPTLAGATITTATLPPGQVPPLPVVAVADDLSPADAEQQIRDQLAADGVDGEVDVKVEDGPEGRRVQVGVRKTETH